VLAATVLAVAALAAPAPQQLLARHTPVLVYARGEAFGASPVDPYLAAAVREEGHLDVTPCDPASGFPAIQCYSRLNGSPTVYGRAAIAGRRIVLSYWLFYSFNFWTQGTPGGEPIWRSHEGDWEEVLVVLDRTGKPLQVGYSRHCGGARKTWSSAPKRGLRPLVYIALGSHANYPSAGRFRHENRCWPAAALAVFRSFKTVPTDVTGGGPTVRPKLVPLAPAPTWLAFPGPWGETGWFHVGDATLAFGMGPLGPAFHATWRDPLRELARWPLRR